MKKYKVISPYVERDKDGEPIGYAKVGVSKDLSDEDGERLTKAKCVEVEVRVTTTPENRGKNDKNGSKRVKRRTSKSE